MSVSTLMRRMQELGAPFEAIMLAVEEIEAMQSQLDARQLADRERKRAQREARKSANVLGQSEDIPGTVTGQSAPNPFPLTPPLKSTPDPKKITPPISPNPPTKRASRLAVDWLPEPLTGKAAAMVACWLPGELERELAKFRNYWMGKAGKDAAKLDWQRTWINWLISADERKPRNDQRSVSRTRPNLTDQLRAAVAASRDLADRDRTGAALPTIGNG